MFWIDTGGTKGIYSAYLNGANVKLLVGDHLDSPDGLAIDFFMDNRLYWTDHKTNIIKSIKYDGGDRATVMQHVGLDRPMRIDIFENHVYWLSKDAGSVNKVDKFGRGIKYTLVERLELADDVKVFHPLKIPANGKCYILKMNDIDSDRITKIIIPFPIHC